MTDWREEQARNETISREMNEWTVEARDEGSNLDPIETYLCECSDARCTDPIELRRTEYEDVRAVSVRFAIAVNHENPEIDQLVAEHERFSVVEKFFGIGSRITRQTDPRR